MANEKDLIVRAASGDRSAFDDIVRPRWDRIFRIALRVVGDPDEAQDVAQSACLKLWNTLERVRPEDDLDAWIYRMVVNQSIDSLRRRRARPEVAWPVSKETDRPFDPQDESPDQQQSVLARELETALQTLTADLPPRQKTAFVLSRVEGLSAPQIGAIMDISPSTVRNHLFQLRAQLGKKLKDQYPELVGHVVDEGEL